jgi:hypothetical protein
MEVVLTGMEMWRGISLTPSILWHYAVRAMIKFISTPRKAEKRDGLYEFVNDSELDPYNSRMCDEYLSVEACVELARFYDKE